MSNIIESKFWWYIFIVYMIYWSYVVFQIQTLEFDEKENASAEKFEEEYARDGKWLYSPVIYGSYLTSLLQLI